MTHAEFLQAELQTATNAYEASHKTNPNEAFYWAGYINAINNALHNYNGQGD